MVMADGRFHPQADRREGRMAAAGRAVSRMIVPGLGLLAVAGAAFAWRGEPVSAFGALGFAGLAFDPGAWFTMAQVWVFGLFLGVTLIGRRYGAGTATGAAAFAFALCGAVWAYAAYGAAHTVLPPDTIAALTAQPMALAVAIGLAAGLLIAIVVFDLVRGRPWWKAPLFGPLLGGAAYAALFHALAAPVLDGGYGERVMTHMAIFAAAVLVMLVIYHVLRPVIRPLPGYGGA